MNRTAVAGSSDDWGRWLGLAAAMVAFGVLPKEWGPKIGAVTALIAFLKFL